MPELTQTNDEFWSKDVSYDQLQKFWADMSEQGRQELLRVDKQALFEKARNNMFCSRCHGFLLEEFSQIVMYQNRKTDGSQGDDDQDPSIHPWGCLATTRDGALTLLDGYLFSTSLKGIQNVFDNARKRERERKLNNPNACGVGGRRWKGPGTREACAVHNARIPLERMVGFWSSLGKESRQSLLKMKEEDFIERLVHRFDRKKFCKDCRKNVVREFKELKELMRIRKEPGFQCEISGDTVQVDWSHTFIDSHRTYHHFEWAIGSEKGKSDISNFQNVGLSGIVQVNGLDLRGLDACYVTLRAWKTDGDCTEFSVKAHTLKGQQCIHRRLLVGDGLVAITEGESIRDFFKHAEEVMKEDADLVDDDGNRLDGECSRIQKHAKTPELAREFLLDAATVIFKEQVEKAFRERTARQNAHSVFVSFALKYLEDSAHVACKEILTLEKQMKLLEEEVMEKNEEEERKERRRIKEREKKLRRKERTRETERHRDDCSPTDQQIALEVSIAESTMDNDKPDAIKKGKVMLSRNEQRTIGHASKNMHNSSDISTDENLTTSSDKNGSSGSDHLEYSVRKLKKRYKQDKNNKCSIHRQPGVVSGSGIMVKKSEQSYLDNHFGSSSMTTTGLNKHSRSSAAKSIIRDGRSKLHERVHCSNMMSDSGELPAHSCYQHSDYRGKVESCCMTTPAGQKYVCKPHPASLDMSKLSNFGNKLTLGDYITDSCGRLNLFVAENVPSSRSSTSSSDAMEPYKNLESSGALCYEVGGQKTVIIKGRGDVEEELAMGNNGPSGFHLDKETCQHSEELMESQIQMCSYLTETKEPSSNSISSSDSRSLCLNEGDCDGSSPNPQIIEPLSTLNSDDTSQQSEERDIPKKQDPFETKPNAPVKKNLNSDISQANDKDFSLFHFGGPFALAAAYKSDPLLEDAVGGLSLTKCIHQSKGDRTCSRKEFIREYSLFASCKGITFSIF
ncbi:hypothetical protein DCAR_0626639 [Daucus carota subsp. sativus]|uniref:Uncharacterized protein n=1 Tax=Daucus carota subsp. sativus TaxID=79200 RepID=A0A161ZX52_DAUCS|nr:PREDICTED: uncharacterized protein LOC108224310 [Daucus carota subsp. sativus]WOH07210.1 hypothetical protein DCAR_0626639 [Daucus carota subsp. sativus]